MSKQPTIDSLMSLNADVQAVRIVQSDSDSRWHVEARLGKAKTFTRLDGVNFRSKRAARSVRDVFLTLMGAKPSPGFLKDGIPDETPKESKPKAKAKRTRKGKARKGTKADGIPDVQSIFDAQKALNDMISDLADALK